MNQRSKRFHTNLVDVAEDVSSSSFWPSVSKSDTESCPDFRSRLSDRLSHIVCLIFSGYTAHGKVKDTVVDTVRRKVSDSQFSFTCNTDRVTSVLRHPPSTGTSSRGKRFLQLFSLFASIILIVATVRHTYFLLASKMKIRPYSQELLKSKTLISRLSGMQFFSSNFFHTVSLVLSYFAFVPFTNVNCFLRYQDSAPFLPLFVGFGFSQSKPRADLMDIFPRILTFYRSRSNCNDLPIDPVCRSLGIRKRLFSAI